MSEANKSEMTTQGISSAATGCPDAKREDDQEAKSVKPELGTLSGRRCPDCNGTGVDWDRWAASKWRFKCRSCKGTGERSAKQRSDPDNAEHIRADKNTKQKDNQ